MWGYAILAVTVVSLVGLVSVAIVPIMQRVFYNYLIQFLVALAIGSLTGDALLHLLPHVSTELNKDVIPIDKKIKMSVTHFPAC